MPKLLDINWICNKSRLMYAPRSVAPSHLEISGVKLLCDVVLGKGLGRRNKCLTQHCIEMTKYSRWSKCPSHQGDQSQMSKAAAVTYSNLSNAPLPSKSACRKQNTYTEAVDFWDLLGLWRHSQHVVKSCSRTLFHNINSHTADGRLW